MKLFPAIALFFVLAFFTFSAAAQEEASWEVKALSQILPGTPEGSVEGSPQTGIWTGTNGMYVRYENPAEKVDGAVLTAESVQVNTKTGDAEADGNVHIQSGDQLWVGEHINYNFKTRVMRSEQFRTGKSPVFASGRQLTGNSTNHVYNARNASVTTDDTADPAFQVRATRIRIIPGKSVEMWNAIVYAEGVPVFYFPYYKRNLGPRANNFLTMPGYNTAFGGYMLNTYRWYLGDSADGKIHVDYRSNRGVGLGPDVSAQLGKWGDFNLKYYYTHDDKPNYSTNAFPQYGNIPQDRQRVNFEWQATPTTNLNLKALVNYQSDPLMLHDFFPGDYIGNPQPNTFVEANKYWDNWSLDALTTPRANSFFDQIERLPDVKLTGFNQQVLDTPVYYDSESSIGWYRSFVTYANTNTPGFFPDTSGYYTNSAMRADTFHQLTLPWTFFNWLNVTPRVGGRLTYYSSGNNTDGTPNSDVTRGVFNTGVGISFKASQLWPDATNSFLQVDGLRHIIEPSVNYAFVPDPSTPPAQLPQFDSEQPSLMLLPVTFPDYNSIDSIDTQNVLRFGLRNVLQTKRTGQLDDLVNWNMMLDWRLDPQPGQTSLNDLYSQIAVKPRTWLTLESQERYNIDDGHLNTSFNQITFKPGERWSWGLAYWYLRGGTWGNGTWTENNNFSSTYFYRVNENYGLRATHYFNADTGRLQEQFYTLYRDLRSWTAALTFRVQNNVGSPTDYTIALQLSLKASPVMHVGDDVVNRDRLVGE